MKFVPSVILVGMSSAGTYNLGLWWAATDNDSNTTPNVYPLNNENAMSSQYDHHAKRGGADSKHFEQEEEEGDGLKHEPSSTTEMMIMPVAPTVTPSNHDKDEESNDEESNNTVASLKLVSSSPLLMKIPTTFDRYNYSSNNNDDDGTTTRVVVKDFNELPVVDAPPSGSRRRNLPVWRNSNEEGIKKEAMIRKQQEEDNQTKRNELLVHPAMLVHENPSVVAIISGSESGISSSNNILNLVDEVEKHNTIEETIMIDSPMKEQDEIKRMQQQGSAVDVVLIDHNYQCEKNDDGMFIMMNSSSSLLSSSSSSSPLVHAKEWYTLLSVNNGILVLRLPTYTILRTRVEELQQAGFTRILDYSSTSTTTTSSKTQQEEYYLIAFTNYNDVSSWHQTEALWNWRLRSRLSSNEPLKFVDSATMLTIEYPSKKSAQRYCNSEQLPKSNDCYNADSGFDTWRETNIPRNQLKVSKSGVGDNAGRGVFTLVDIQPDSYITLEDTVHSIRANWKTTNLLLDFDAMHENDPSNYMKYRDYKNKYFAYLDGYGFNDEPWGSVEYTVDSSLLTFTNHGCNGTNNLGKETEYTEFTVDLNRWLIEQNQAEESSSSLYFNFNEYDIVYNPTKERRITKYLLDTTGTKPIKAGEELLDNYLLFGGTEYFEENVNDLRNECSGGLGLVEYYQINGEFVVVNS